MTKEFDTIAIRQHKLFWGSSYDRGCQYLLKMWPKIREVYPDAELHFCYGWVLFDAAYTDNKERQKWKQEMQYLMEAHGITEHGRLSKKKLAKLRQSCGIWAYPTDFGETNCHPKGVFVNTNRGDIEIEKLRISDMAYTPSGYKRITAIRSHSVDEYIYKITPQSGEDVEMTGDHPVLVISNNHLDSQGWKERIKEEKRWIKTKDINVGDILIIPRHKFDNNRNFEIDYKKYQRNETNNFKIDNNVVDFSMDKKKAWWFGYFAGDGNANNRGKVSALVAKKHIDRDMDKVLAGFKSFGLPVKIYDRPGYKEVASYSYTLCRYLKDNFYTPDRKKTIPIELVNAYPNEVFEGLLSSDGFINESYIGSGKNYAFTNTSRHLISIMRDVLAYKGFTGRISPRLHEHGTTSYTINWTVSKGGLKFYHADSDYIYLRVNKINREKFVGDVYNIDVEDEHLYQANGIIVHNCITALDCQKDGVVPCVINKAGLRESVQSGVRIEGDIVDQEVYDEYLEAILDLMGDAGKWQTHQEKGVKWAKKFTWDKQAVKWTKNF